VEVHADTPTAVVDASASPPRRCGRKREEGSPAVAEAEVSVKVHADSSVVVVDASASPPRRCGTKRERSPVVAEAVSPVKVSADSPTVLVDASASPPRRCERKRERAASPDIVELCDSAGRGRDADGEDKAPAAKKGSLAALCTVLQVWDGSCW
jgi:tyrosyl-DNA phosphodiesterase 2